MMYLAACYVYELVDADGVVRYVGKGTGRRSSYHRGKVLALVSGALVTRASKVHRRFAAEMRRGRDFSVVVVDDGLTQPEAYEIERKMIAMYRRDTEGGQLWNVLAGGEGFKGILRDDWILVSRQAVETKALTGSGKGTGAKAAKTKARTGSGKGTGARAWETRRTNLAKLAGDLAPLFPRPVASPPII